MIKDKLKYTPCILLGTSGCSIGAGLDSNDVKLVFRDGISTNILNFIKESGRCGIGDDSDSNNYSNKIEMYFNIQNFVYLNERLYIRKESTPDNETQDNQIAFNEDLNLIISKEEKKLCLNVGC